ELKRHLLQRRVADLLRHPIARQVNLSAYALGLEPTDDLAEVLLVLLGDGNADDLHGREPHGKSARVVLKQNGEKPLDRAEQRTVDHDRLLLGAVSGGVLQVEALWLVEVELHGR